MSQSEDNDSGEEDEWERKTVWLKDGEGGIHSQSNPSENGPGRLSINLTPAEYQKMRAEGDFENSTFSKIWRRDIEKGRREETGPRHGQTNVGDSFLEEAMAGLVVATVHDNEDGVKEEKLHDLLNEEILNPEYDPRDDDDDERPIISDVLEQLNGTKIEYVPQVGYVPK